MEELVKESIEVINWYMENCKPENDDYQTFFNIGSNYLVSAERKLKT